MAETIPPYEPPLADTAPPQLTAFLYYLVRDFLPVGAVQHCLAMATPAAGAPTTFHLSDIGEYAERTARQLAHDGS